MKPSSWTPTPLPDAPAVLGAQPGKAWAALASGQVFHASADGLDWTPLPGASLPAEPIALLATTDALLATTEAGLFRWTPGQCWQLSAQGLPADDVVTALAEGEGAVVAGTLGSGLWRSRDGGATWQPSDAGMPLRGHRLSIFALAAGQHGLFAAHPLGLSRSLDGGASWQSASFGLPPAVPINALFGGATLWASGGGAIFRSDDGCRWRSVYAQGSAPPLVLIARAGTTLVARQTDGTRLFHSRDGGISWQTFHGALPPDTYAVGGVDAGGALLVATLPGGVWRWAYAAQPPAAPPIELLPERDTAPADVDIEVHDAAAHVVLSVHDAAGSEVMRLLDGPAPRGRWHYGVGGALPPGFYEWRLTGGDTRQARSFLLLG